MAAVLLGGAMGACKLDELHYLWTVITNSTTKSRLSHTLFPEDE